MADKTSRFIQSWGKVEPIIRFCQMPDGARLAYAVLGSGPPLLQIPGWLSHLEADWQSVRMGEEFAADFTVIRYDKRGTGLSDRKISDFSLEAKLRDLSALVDTLELERFSVFAGSEGGPLAVAFAALNPRRVRKLALWGCFAYGRDIAGGQKTREAIANLARANWPLASAAMADLMMPGATTEAREISAARAREAAEPEVAAGYLESFIATDIRTLLPRVTVPTLVLHSRGDQLIPIELGREMASGIRGAIFEVLPGDRHVATPELRQTRNLRVLEFLRAEDEINTDGPIRGLPVEAAVELSPREREVLRLVAAGRTNQQIADELVISVNTVFRHVSHIFEKTGVANRVEATAFAHRSGLIATE